MNQDNAWEEVSIADLKIYTAILIYMGTNGQQAFKLYWRTSLNTPCHPIVGGSMPRRRFEAISRYFHVCDPPTEGTHVTPFNKVRNAWFDAMKLWLTLRARSLSP